MDPQSPNTRDAKGGTNWRHKPRWRLVAPGTPNQAPVWKFTGPKKCRGPKKKLNATKIREARKILRDRWSTSGPERMRARETLENLNMEPPDTSSEDSTDSEPENDSGLAGRRPTPPRNPGGKRGARKGQRRVAWNPPSHLFRGFEVTYCRLEGDRELSYREGQGWMEHTSWAAKKNYRPPTPPGGGFYQWTSITSPTLYHDDSDHVSTLRESALATAAICVAKKKDLDKLPVPNRLRAEIKCWHHRFYPEEYQEETRYNTGECAACCRTRCVACCCKFSKARVPDLPSPPDAGYLCARMN